MSAPARTKNAVSIPGPASLDWLRVRTLEDPDRPALWVPGSPVVTCGDLWRASNAVAAVLEAAGIRRGSVVGLVISDGPEFLAGFLGITRVAACAPLNPSLLPSELGARLSKLGALLVESLDSPIAEVAREHGIPVVEYREGKLRPDGTAQTPKRQVEDDVLLLLETSATTGRPKLVPISDANFAAMARNSLRSLGLTEQDRFLSLMPLFHLQGLLSSLMQIQCGGTVAVVKGFDPKQFFSWMKEVRPTWYTAGPSLHRSIVALLRERSEDAPQSSLRFVRSIGAAMPAGLLAEIENALGVPVLEGYGLTEAGAVTGSPFPPLPRKPGSAGRSTGVEVAICDDDGRPLPAGAEGEICVRGPSVIKGYLDDPEANRLAFTAGWLRTGDLGRFDADGYLFVTGRIKEMINRGGEKFLPQDVESALNAHPAVLEAVGFSIPHPSLGEDVAAAVVLRPGASTSEAELRSFAASRLAAFKIPRRIFIRTEIPKSATGKPQRHMLFERVRPPFAPPSSPLERQAAQIWSRILKTERIGVDDDFFTVGGDSLAVTLVIAELERETGCPVPADRFFAEPTIRALACLLEDAVTPVDPAVLTLRSRGTLTPFFCFAGASEDYSGLRHLAESIDDDRPFYVLRNPQSTETRGVYTVEDVVDQLLLSIRALQPFGPYLLGGHCFGGILAFEAARRLAQSGCSAPVVILMDTPAPGFPKILPQIVRRRQNYRREILKMMRGDGQAAREITSSTFKLAALLRRRAARKLGRALISAGAPGLMPATEDPNVANIRAARHYAPVHFSGKVIQLMSSKERVNPAMWEDSRLGWREFAGGGFDSHSVPGDHNSMLAPPHVLELGALVNAVLAGAETSTSFVR